MRQKQSNFPPFGHFAEPKHNHTKCLHGIQIQAEEICRRRGVRLTEIRRNVLDLVWRSHQPIGAYEILAMLNEDGGSTAPPTVYRALDFLLEQGLVHRIETLNAFLGCSDPERAHKGCFLICRVCRSVAEVEGKGIDVAIDREANSTGFTVEGSNVEVHGICPGCADGNSQR